MAEEKKRINAFVPADLYEQVMSKGYATITEAIIKGFERLLEPIREDFDRKADTNPKEDSSTLNTELIQSLQNQIKTLEERLSKVQDPSGFEQLKKRTEEQQSKIEEYKAQALVLNNEIARLKNLVMEAPDPIELAVTKKDNEGLKLLLEEREKRIEELYEHKENMSRFADYFRSIEPKLIEAPAAERKKPWWKLW
jgi:predicted RNase H-like nuclease (RuvC/YqgF family)